MRLDVALGRRQVGVAGERLDVPQRPANGRYLSSGVGDESPSAAVAGAPGEAEVGVPAGEQVHDRLGGGSGSALRRHHEGGRAASGGRQAQVEEGRLLISTES